MSFVNTVRALTGHIPGAPRAALLVAVLAATGAVMALTALAPAGAARGAAAGTMPVVGAENFYGDLLAQVGGARVRVTSILTNPNADPHDFESSIANAVAVSDARLVVMNGAGYDTWMAQLLAASPRPYRRVIDVASGLLGVRAGDNPHVWYRPGVFARLARVIAADLAAADPGGKRYYAARLDRFTRSLAPLDSELAALRRRFRGAYVLATERVFGYAAGAIGLRVPNSAFQRAVEDGNDPPPQAIAAFQADLVSRRARLLLYNTQAPTPMTVRMRDLALRSRIPVVGVTETEPPGKDYQQWQLTQLLNIDRALSARR